MSASPYSDLKAEESFVDLLFANPRWKIVLFFVIVGALFGTALALPRLLTRLFL